MRIVLNNFTTAKHPTIISIINEVGKIDAVTKASGDIFEKAPI